MSSTMNRLQIEETLSGVFATEQVDALAQVFGRIVGDDGERSGIRSDLRSLTRRTDRIAELGVRTAQHLETLAASQGRTEQRVEELATAQARTEVAVEGLATAQARTEVAVEGLATAQARTEVAIEGLAVLTGEMLVAQRNTDVSLARLAQQVGGLSNDFGLHLEDFSGALLPSWLDRHHGLRGLVFERHYTVLLDGTVEEVDLMATGEQGGQPVTVLAEVKARLGGSEARRMADKLDRVAQALDQGAVVKVIVGMAIHPTAQEALRERDILLIPYSWINRDRG